MIPAKLIALFAAATRKLIRRYIKQEGNKQRKYHRKVRILDAKDMDSRMSVRKIMDTKL